MSVIDSQILTPTELRAMHRPPADVVQIEILRCSTDFWYWAEHYAQVQDRRTQKWVPFDPNPAQTALLESLLAGEWALGCKVRRLGFTTAVLVFCVWLIELHAGMRALIISRRLESACQLLEWYAELVNRMPVWMRQRNTVSNRNRQVKANHSEIQAEAGTEASGRMSGMDFLFVDEARFVQALRACLPAAEETLSTTRGVSCVVSTGTPGTYYETLTRATDRGETKYKLHFWGWRARSDITEERYWDERRQHTHNLAKFLNDYPDTLDEAFLASSGRVFSQFGPHHIRQIAMPDHAKRFRAFDFGYAPGHQWVCVWLWHDEKSNPGFSWEPDCDVIRASDELIDLYAHGVRQMYAFRRKEDHPHIPIEVNDDIPDALAYAFAQFRFTGHVHVYRTYSAHSGQQQFTLPSCVYDVMRLSGWHQVPGEINRFLPSPDRERYAGNVADRAAVASYPQMNQIVAGADPTLIAYPYKDLPGGVAKSQKEARFSLVNAALCGQESPIKVEIFTDHAQSMSPYGVVAARNVYRGLTKRPRKTMGI